jgi:aspartyl-tRNA(Asn)/glutamyl-tRNA(Gln) amidotransferase subunit C
MSFNQDNVKKLAHLARLAVYENTNNTTSSLQLQSFADSIADNLSNIISMIEQINELDTTSVQPMSHPLEVTQRLRSDLVTETNTREELQAIATTNSTEAGLYLVPKVVE